MSRNRRPVLLAFLLIGWVLAQPAWAVDPAPALSGSVFDANRGTPVEGVEVSATGTAPESQPAITHTAADGSYEFGSLPPGSYSVRFRREGYSETAPRDVEVGADQSGRADARLARISSEEVTTAAAPLVPDAFQGIEEIEVTGNALDQDAAREQSDEQIDTMSADKFSDFSIPDVAAGLRFVPGVSVVDGQFAVIRGLEDRYNSTLFNSAPIPSPDPDRQSVQLDLFPSDVVSNLVIAKTFAQDLPSNSSGGSVNILTNGETYDDDFQLKLSAATGFNANARDRFIEFEDGSPIGDDSDKPGFPKGELGAALRGFTELGSREIQYKGVYNWEVDYGSAEGQQETREPLPGSSSVTGGMAQGRLDLSGGRFDLTDSGKSEQQTGYFGLGGSVDEDGNHGIEASVFYTDKREEAVLLKENGYFPGLDYAALATYTADGGEVSPNQAPPYGFEGVATPNAWMRRVRATTYGGTTQGPPWFASFADSKSVLRERDLIVSQLNGDHWIDAIEGLHVSWAGNFARTTQEDEASGARFFFEPTDLAQVPPSFPSSVDQFGPGRFGVNNGIFLNTNDVEEKQGFGRLDLEYEVDLSDSVALRLSLGGYYEDANRDVSSTYLENPSVQGSSQFAIVRDTPVELGSSIFGSLSRQAGNEPAGTRHTTTDAEREITAWSLGAKATFWEQLDVLGGFRFEEIFIESLNDPFTNEIAYDGSPRIFPNKWLFFDRQDNPAYGEPASPPGTTFNDQLLGVKVPIDPVTGLVDLRDRAAIETLVNGEIDERRSLPSLAFTYRAPGGAFDGLTLRGAFSQTVARPSFREMGYFVTVETASDDLIVGNPQLQLSDVESWDLRAEYRGNDLDLAAVSFFTKEIDDPIESIVVRDPSNFESADNALYRTFFNNPGQADLQGIEVEASKNLGFLGSDFWSYFTLGANGTYIDAEVDRNPAEFARSASFFRVASGDQARFTGLEKSRRLFGQPEWIANLNLQFDHPDWGTRGTISFFAISDLLDAAGSAAISRDGTTYAFTPDRYVDSYNQLDLTLSQTWRNFTFKLNVKNLTDTERRLIYDPDQTAGTIEERSYKVGRTFKFTVSYPF
jgi:hypothetical protein